MTAPIIKEALEAARECIWSGGDSLWSGGDSLETIAIIDAAIAGDSPPAGTEG